MALIFCPWLTSFKAGFYVFLMPDAGFGKGEFVKNHE